MKPALFSHVIRRIRGGGKGGRKHWKSENSGDHYFNYLKYFAKHINTSKIHFLIFIGYLKTHLLGIKRVAFSVKLSHFHLSNYCLRMRKRENTTFRRVLIAFIFLEFNIFFIKPNIVVPICFRDQWILQQINRPSALTGLELTLVYEKVDPVTVNLK